MQGLAFRAVDVLHQDICIPVCRKDNVCNGRTQNRHSYCDYKECYTRCDNTKEEGLAGSQKADCAILGLHLIVFVVKSFRNNMKFNRTPFAAN